jgi:hypothetical protein
MPYVARDAVDKTVNQLEQRDVAFGAAHVLEFIVGKSATGFTQSMTSHSLSRFQFSSPILTLFIGQLYTLSIYNIRLDKSRAGRVIKCKTICINKVSKAIRFVCQIPFI